MPKNIMVLNGHGIDIRVNSGHLKLKRVSLLKVLLLNILLAVV